MILGNYERNDVPSREGIFQADICRVVSVDATLLRLNYICDWNKDARHHTAALDYGFEFSEQFNSLNELFNKINERPSIQYYDQEPVKSIMRFAEKEMIHGYGRYYEVPFDAILRGEGGWGDFMLIVTFNVELFPKFRKELTQ